MSSDKEFVEYIAGQIHNAGSIRHRKMFGEYAIYCNNKIVALICDNQVFIKKTEGGRIYIGETVEAPPYPGAKSSFLIEDGFENAEWFSELIRITEKEMPEPKTKNKR